MALEPIYITKTPIAHYDFTLPYKSSVLSNQNCCNYVNIEDSSVLPHIPGPYFANFIQFVNLWLNATHTLIKRMKHIFFIVLIIFCGLLPSYSQKSNAPEFEPYTNDAEIEVILKGAPSGKVKLLAVYGDGNQLKDSTFTDANEKAVFKNKERYPAGLYYAVYSDFSYIQFLMDQNQHFYLHSEKADLNNKMETNSAENKLFYSNLIYETELAAKMARVNTNLKTTTAGTVENDKLKNEQKALLDEKEQLVKSYVKNNPGSFFAAFKYMGQNPRLKEPKNAKGELDTVAQVMMYRNEYWDNFDFTDGRMVHTPVFNNKLKNYLTTLYPQRADSVLVGAKYLLRKTYKGNKELFQFTVNYILTNYQKSTIMGGEKILCYTIDSFYTKDKVFWADSFNLLQAKIKADKIRPSLLGAVGQDLKCKNDKGEYVSLYDIKKPIRVIFLYNPDCDHCQKETPKLLALYHKWKEKMEVYALNVEKDYDKWHDFIKKYELDWINVIDPKYESKHYLKYDVQITPGLYVIDKNNIIVSKQVMPDNLEPLFETLTKE